MSVSPLGHIQKASEALESIKTERRELFMDAFEHVAQEISSTL